MMVASMCQSESKGMAPGVFANAVIHAPKNREASATNQEAIDT